MRISKLKMNINSHLIKSNNAWIKNFLVNGIIDSWMKSRKNKNRIEGLLKKLLVLDMRSSKI